MPHGAERSERRPAVDRRTTRAVRCRGHLGDDRHALPCSDHGHERHDLFSATDNAGLEPRAMAKAEYLIAEAMNVIEQNKRLVHDVGKPDLRLRREAMFGRQSHYERLGVQFLDVEPVIPNRQCHQADIEFTREKVGEKSLGQVLFEVKLNGRMLFPKRTTVLGRTNGATVGIAPTRSNPPSAESRTARSASPTAARMDCAAAEQFVSGISEHNLPPEAVEEPPAESVRLAFQPEDLFA